MSANSTSGSGAEDLQFDRAIDPQYDSASGNAVCAKCNSPIRMYYYNVDGETTCSSCKQAAERASGGGKSGGGMMMAMLYGVGAAIAGAIIYYAVMEYMNLEIGIVAILIGFMVGYAIRSAMAGRGGRRFQILAAGLTYFAVALAYAPFAFREMSAEDKIAADSAGTETSSGDQDLAAASNESATVDADDEVDANSAVESESIGAGGFALGLGGGLLFVLALPVIAILGSMPSGLISALIIGLGMQQAWKMTRASEVTITGPFRIGAEPLSAAS